MKWMFQAFVTQYCWNASWTALCGGFEVKLINIHPLNIEAACSKFADEFDFEKILDVSV